jgi:hypothetical protein
MIGDIKIATFNTGANIAGDSIQLFGKWKHKTVAVFQQKQNSAPRRSWSKPRKAAKPADQIFK